MYREICQSDCGNPDDFKLFKIGVKLDSPEKDLKLLNDVLHLGSFPTATTTSMSQSLSGSETLT